MNRPSSEDSLIARVVRILTEHLNPGSRILELGSGQGDDIKSLNEVFRVTGSEKDLAIVEKLNQTFPGLVFEKVDARNVVVKESFDCIYSNRVLHHFDETDLENSLDSQVSTLRANGLLAHLVWNRDRLGEKGSHPSKSEWKHIFSQVGEIVEFKEMDYLIERDLLLFVVRSEWVI